MKINNLESDEDDIDFDFGFNTHNQVELEDLWNSTGEGKKDTQGKLDDLYKAIQPLLANLAKNPDREYIMWPDRAKKVTEFKERLKKIYES